METVEKRLKAPVRGVLIAVELEELWPRTWGERPLQEEQVLKQAGDRLKKAARLIRLFMLAALPYAEAFLRL